MWWMFKKILDDGQKMTFLYSFESYELNGKIEYDKRNDKFRLLVPSEKGGMAGYLKLCGHLLHKIKNADIPEGEHMIATG